MLKSEKDIHALIQKQSKNGELSCADAFRLSKEFRILMEDIGKGADHLKIKLIKCQLGLFGYSPVKKILKTDGNVCKNLENTIQKALDNGRLNCKDGWAIAEYLKLGKLEVGCACEIMKIKIKKCRLGAF